MSEPAQAERPTTISRRCPYCGSTHTHFTLMRSSDGRVRDWWMCETCRRSFEVR